MKIRIFSFLVILFLANQLFSQEVLTPLYTNPSLTNNKIERSTNKSLIDISKPLVLPFFDDFSGNGPYPSISHWVDSNVFINKTEAINTVTLGVASFDAINKYGKLYSNTSNSGFFADKLTSRFVKLDSAVTPADSVYISFYIQPQGVGKYPDVNDSLVLQFKAFPPDTIYIAEDTAKLILADTIAVDRWVRVWAHEGMTYDAFNKKYGCDFKQIRIPIIDTAYFRGNFQFRFLNYASVAVTPQNTWADNTDFWHLDYVYLNKNRSFNDSIIDDIALTKAQPSLLKYYSSMPWKHFLVNASSEMNTSFTMPYQNLGNNTKNVKRDFYITDLKGTGIPYAYTGGNLNQAPFEKINFEPQVTYAYNSNVGDSASFEVVTTINTTPDFNRSNDTARFIQNFYNYYAYDDGAPEAGFGLDNSPGGKIACKFNTRKADTIRGVNIYFNNTLRLTNEALYFDLTIWKSLSPEVIIYQKAGLLPKLEDSLNEFHYYRIDTAISVSGDFYVGMRQTGADNLNIGFDKNAKFGVSNDLVFVNYLGSWVPSLSAKKGGMPMIRPVFGKRVPYAVGIVESAKTENAYQLFPNPANDILYISNTNQDHNYALTILDLSGRVVLTEQNAHQVNISNLNPGYYIATIISDNAISHKQKLIIIRQ